jgi:hypothetical protein
VFLFSFEEAKRRREMIFKEGDKDNVFCPFQENCTCDGSACAAWRWIEKKADGRKPRDRYGFCGLAGKPEFN